MVGDVPLEEPSVAAREAGEQGQAGAVARVPGAPSPGLLEVGVREAGLEDAL